MIYLSVCSGIEAATVAWEPLGWQPVGFAEIEKAPSAVLAHHYPHVKNYGDFTSISGLAIDLLVGGTPCQSFSIAGKRAGLDDPRGNLTIEFARLADRLRPRWLVWENVPGVLSIDDGRAFGAFLGLLGKLGYGFAYRVLDAKHFGVPQRHSLRADLESGGGTQAVFGIDIPSGAVNAALKPHQKLCIEWLVRGGRRALFASFGLGKTAIQLETLRLLLDSLPGAALIVAPLTPSELDGLQHHAIFKRFCEQCECTVSASLLPKKFMLLQPQSWHEDVWTDITRMLNLNGAQSAKGKEMHLCPMQFDLADRVIEQFSMSGEIVYDPFAGLMTVPYRAVLLGRYGRGCELSPAYFADGVRYLREAERKANTPSLFDALEVTA